MRGDFKDEARRFEDIDRAVTVQILGGLPTVAQLEAIATRARRYRVAPVA